MKSVRETAKMIADEVEQMSEEEQHATVIYLLNDKIRSAQSCIELIGLGSVKAAGISITVISENGVKACECTLDPGEAKLVIETMIKRLEISKTMIEEEFESARCN